MSEGSLTAKTASILLITSMLGAGINFMPSAFESVGYANALLIMSVITAFTFFTLYAICCASRKYCDDKELSYSSIAYNVSYSLGIIVDLSIVLVLYLVCLAFYNYIVGMSVLFFTGLSAKDTNYNLYKFIFMTIIMIIFYMVSMMKDLNSLRYTAYACVASVFYLIMFLIVMNIVVGDKIRTGEFKAINNNYSSGIAILMLAMSCQINMVKVYGELKEKTTRNILIVSMASAMGGGIIYSTVGFFGYKLFGKCEGSYDIVNICCDRNSFLNVYLKKNHSILKYLPQIGIIGAFMVLMGSFPLQINPAAYTLVKIIKTDINPDKLRVVIISLMCGSIFLINLYPDLNLNIILGVVGAVFNNMLAFIFPCIFYISTSKSFDSLSLLSMLIILICGSCGLYIVFSIVKSFF